MPLALVVAVAVVARLIDACVDTGEVNVTSTLACGALRLLVTNTLKSANAERIGTL